MNKQEYLNNHYVKDFIDYFVDFVDGNSKLDNMPVVIIKNNSSITRMYSTIEDTFKKYSWNEQNYDENAKKLDEIQKLFSQVENEPDKFSAMMNAIEYCMEWGFGKKKSTPKIKNIKWAQEKNNIHEILNNILCNLLSENPDLSQYNKDNFRLNSGYSKIYSFMAPNQFAIYDSRVAGALGRFIVQFCEEKQLIKLPEVLHFYLPSGQNTGNRNPSKGIYNLLNTDNDNIKHAESNIRFNWILEATLQKSKANWHNNEMRRIEAALFMLGESFPVS